MGERYGLFFHRFPTDYPEKSRALLTGFALSGIQGFLFGGIDGEWTPARVRRASRYVSLATEAVGDHLVRAMGGYRPRPLMMSSGKGWLLTAPGTPLEKLERELVRLLLEDKKVKEIAALRCVEVVTVKTQIKSLLRKFGCTRTKEIVATIRELNVAHLF